jgi:hypothetical protein
MIFDLYLPNNIALPKQIESKTMDYIWIKIYFGTLPRVLPMAIIMYSLESYTGEWWVKDDIWLRRVGKYADIVVQMK